ncbi:MAG: EamA family transporter [Leptolyngbyaceae cyanobacterium]
MEPLNPQSAADNGQPLEQLLQTLRQDLIHLQQDVVAQLVQDVNQLQQEKAQLTTEIEQLTAARQVMQTEQETWLSAQQQTQQQLWARQLAQILANHLQRTIVERLDQIADHPSSVTGEMATAESGAGEKESSHTSGEEAQRLLVALDSSFSATFKALERELNNYHSTLFQQISRMQDLEQQGEAVLTALVRRLQEQSQITETTALQSPATPGKSSRSMPSPSSLSPTQLGFLYAFLSTIAFSIHNVIVRVIGRESNILGLLRWGGAVPQLDLGNSLMTLWLRMMVVLPLMVVIAKLVYPHFWEDIQWRLNARDRRERKPLVFGVISGIFLFLSQLCIYIAIGRIGPGSAVTLLFMYPLFTVLLSWLWLKKMRPTPMLWAVIGVIFWGVLLTLSPGGKLGSLDRLGVTFACFAGIFFALYMTWMDLSFETLKAIPVKSGVAHAEIGLQLEDSFNTLKKPILITLIQFTTVCLLSNLILLLPINLDIRITKIDQLILGGLVIGALALIAYLLNNFAVQKIGPESASIMSSLGPVLTSILALLLIQEPLKPVQWLGVVLVTAGVAAFTVEKNSAKRRT